MATLDDVRQQISLARSAITMPPSTFNHTPLEGYDVAGVARILQVQVLHLGNALNMLTEVLDDATRRRR